MEEGKRFPLIVGLVVLAVIAAYAALRPAATPNTEPVEDSGPSPALPAKPVFNHPATEAVPEPPQALPQMVAKAAEPPEEQPKPGVKESEKVVEAAPTVAEIDDVVKALEYRDSYLPSGYSLTEGSGAGATNPGYYSAEALGRASRTMPKDLGVQLTLTRAYSATFKDRAHGTYVTYTIFELGSADDAATLQNAMTSKLAQRPTRQQMLAFAMRNCLVMVSSPRGEGQVGQTLLAKLKAAVNYKD